MGRLRDKTALVTGGASGLGRAIAQRMALEGARVVISDVQTDAGRTTARECDCAFIEQDVASETRWGEVIREIEDDHGPLHILVNNAGILGPMDAVSPEATRLLDWRRVFAVNVESVFLGCRAGIAAMRRAGGGSIVNISSIAALLSTPYATAYGASKAAVRHLTKSVAQHCALEKLAIRCNSVHPGNVRTSLWEKQARDAAAARGIAVEILIEEARAAIPMGDFTTPQDVAGVVAFLASDDARYVTGEQLIVDGGVVHCDTYWVSAKAARPGESIDA